MSLFGSSPEDNTGTNAKGITSQFSLFDGDGNGSGGPAHQDSGMPHSKRTAPHDLLKTLLPREDAPGAYTEAYDAVVQSEDRAEKGGVTADEVRKMLATTGLPSEEQDRIHRMLFANDQQAGQVLGRNEFNVFLALTALAQEGEDPTFDTIDERQNTLPTPKIGYIDDLQSSHDSHSDRPQTAETDESTISQRQPRHSATFAFPDHDPWASPDVPRAAPELLNGASERATSSAMPHSLTFPTAGRKPSYDSMNNGRGSIDNLGSRSSFGNGTWVDPFPANSAGFMDDTAATFGGGFENLGQDRTQTSTNNLSRTLGGGKIPAPKEDEIISITMLPEKEGIFMFQHRNYEVKSHRRNTSVIRRFSDFAWLHDCLTKRYPFRQIPLLPPKRVG
ncbi:Sorting nexin mvp1, partial [Ascosphaera atra]